MMDDNPQVEEKTDSFGFLYFDALPVGYHQALLDDFHVKGVKKAGMKYLIRWSDREYYEVRTVTDKLTGEYLKPFLAADRVFVKT